MIPRHPECTSPDAPGPADRPAVTVLIPHYQTPEALRLCLRSLRAYARHPQHVIVLDQGSDGESLALLRSVEWIGLRRTTRPNDPARSHADALNDAVARVDTPLFLIMHSDAFVLRQGWLDWLVAQLTRRRLAALGSGAQLLRPLSPGQAAYQHARALLRRCRPGATVPRLRSVCALYRTAAFRRAGCHFELRGSDVTHTVSSRLVQAGERIAAVPGPAMASWLFHLPGTTRRATGSYGGSNGRRNEALMREFLGRREVAALQHDDSLDRSAAPRALSQSPASVRVPARLGH